jgi:hypothetical protein
MGIGSRVGGDALAAEGDQEQAAGHDGKEQAIVASLGWLPT